MHFEISANPFGYVPRPIKTHKQLEANCRTCVTATSYQTQWQGEKLTGHVKNQYTQFLKKQSV